MIKNKKAIFVIGPRLVRIIALVFAFLMIVIVVANPLKLLKSKEDAMACEYQIGLASKFIYSDFLACKTYILVFEENSAVKKDISNLDKKPLMEYEYKEYLSKLKLRNKAYKPLELTDSEGNIAEEVIYFILAEEMKACHDTFYVPKLMATRDKIPQQSSCAFSDFCQQCSIVMFGENFKYSSNKLSGFRDFLMNIPVVDSAEVSYYDFFKDYYIDNVLSFKGQSSFSEKDYNKFILEKNRFVFDNKGFNIYLDNLYIIELIYRPELSTKTGFGRYVTSNVEPYIINLIPQHEESSVCEFYMGMLPDATTNPCFT